MAIPKFFRAILTGLERKPTPTEGAPGSGQQRMPEGEVVKKAPEGLNLFGSKKFVNKPFIDRQRLRDALKKAPAHIPGGGSFSFKQRLELEEGLFPKRKFGAYITPYEVNRRLRQLKKEIFRARTTADKLETRRKFRFLENLRGPSDKQLPQ